MDYCRPSRGAKAGGRRRRCWRIGCTPQPTPGGPDSWSRGRRAQRQHRYRFGVEQLNRPLRSSARAPPPDGRTASRYPRVRSPAPVDRAPRNGHLRVTADSCGPSAGRSAWTSAHFPSSCRPAPSPGRSRGVPSTKRRRAGAVDIEHDRMRKTVPAIAAHGLEFARSPTSTPVVDYVPPRAMSTDSRSALPHTNMPRLPPSPTSRSSTSTGSGPAA